jgi:spermidine/putrescine transport system substrate-binding protein
MDQRTTQRSTRRRWLAPVAGLAALVLVLVACAPDEAPAPDAPEEPVDEVEAPDPEPAPDATADSLTILEWAGYELEEFYPAFLDQYPDVTLDFQFGDGDADFLTKTQTGAVDPHIIHPCSGWIGLWRDAGLIHPVDTGLLSHWDDLDPAMRELGEHDGEYYFVPFDWGYTSIVVATDRVDEPLTSWQDLWDPQYQGRISVWNDAEEAVVMTAIAFGMDPWNLSDDDVEEVRQRLSELHGQVLTYWEDVSSLDAMMIGGEVDIAQSWNETYAAMIDAGVAAEYVDPVEGRLGWVCGFSIAAEPGTPEYELAHAYIDAAIAPEAGQYLVDAYYYGHANLATLDVADPDVVELIELDRLDVRDRTVFYEPLTEEQRELFSRLWTEATAG